MTDKQNKVTRGGRAGTTLSPPTQLVGPSLPSCGRASHLARKVDPTGTSWPQIPPLSIPLCPGSSWWAKETPGGFKATQGCPCWVWKPLSPAEDYEGWFRAVDAENCGVQRADKPPFLAPLPVPRAVKAGGLGMCPEHGPVPASGPGFPGWPSCPPKVSLTSGCICLAAPGPSRSPVPIALAKALSGRWVRAKRRRWASPWRTSACDTAAGNAPLPTCGASLLPSFPNRIYKYIYK